MESLSKDIGEVLTTLSSQSEIAIEKLVAPSEQV